MAEGHRGVPVLPEGLLENNMPPSAELLLSKLQLILRGERGLALADDLDLDYDDAVELRLLLEKLGGV